MPDPILENPSAADAAEAADKMMAALVTKHRAQIDQVKLMDSASQQEVFKQLGVDPKALESYYAPLEQRGIELRRKDAQANKKIVTGTWASFAAGIAGMFAFTSAKRFRPESTLVRGFMVGLSGPVAAVGGNYVASRAFANDVREESRLLTIEARSAFERELAVALENREQSVKASASAQAPGQGVAANVPKRDASFAAQAATDKSAANAVEAGRA